MKRRIISAVATGLVVLTLLTSTTGITLAGTGDKNQLPRASLPARPEDAVGTGFTYQGSLKDGGNPANGQYDLQFTLFDAATGGSQVSSPVTVSNQSVTNGLFTVQLDFGPSAFQGSSRWLEIAVRSAGGGSFTALSPRQPLTAAPYAMSLEPGAVITGSVSSDGTLLSALATGQGNAIFGQSSGGSGVYGTSAGTNQGGVLGENYSGFGVIGNGFTGVSGVGTYGDGLRGATTYGKGVSGSSSYGPGGYFASDGADAVQGHANGSNVSGVAGFNTGSGPGTFGTSTDGDGVRGVTTSGNGGNFTSANGYGVSGQSTDSYGVYGASATGVAGYFTSTNGTALEADANNSSQSVNAVNTGSGTGVHGQTATGDGVQGYSASGTGVSGISGGANAGVYGASASGRGLYGVSTNGDGVYGTTGSDHNAVFGENTAGGNGVAGQSASGSGVYGTSAGTNQGGVLGENYSGFGVIGNGFTGVSGVGTVGDGLRGATMYGNGVSGSSTYGFGGYFTSDSGNGVLGQATGSNVAGVSGSNGSSGPGTYGTSDSGPGASGISGSGRGVSGQSASGVGGYFTSTSNDAVQGHANGGNVSGVAGFNTGSGPGTYGTSGTGPGLSGMSDSGAGATGQSTSGYGVSGTSSSGDGVNGVSSSGNGGSFTTSSNARYAVFGVQYGQSGTAIMGTATNGSNSVGVAGSGGSDGVDGFGQYYGVYGKGTGTTHFTVSVYGADPANHCSNCYAGYFDYNVNVNGTLSANLMNFKIDDPLDPANKYLIHTSVESPDMMNIYNGNVTLDARGEAVVQMPDYFQALNTDFRYQLSAIGAAQPNLYVAQEIKDNKFKIAGGAPGGEVSWQVTGVRHDPYALANPSPVEVQKPPEEQGLYQHPELYNQPASKAISTLHDHGTLQPPAQPPADTKGNK